MRDASGNFSAGVVSANLDGQWQRIDDRTIAPSDINSGYAKFGFTSWANNNSSPYADFLHLRSYTDATGGNDNLVMFRKDQIGMRIYQQTWGSATPYSSYKDVAFQQDIDGSFIKNQNSLAQSANFWINGNGMANQFQLQDANTTLSKGSGNSLQVTTADGYLQIGPQNSSWMHFITDRTRSYFNKGISVDEGLIGSYDENLQLQTSGTTRITVLNSNGNVGIGNASPVSKLTVDGGSANWNETTPGLTVGSVHLDPGTSNDHYGSAITWGASDASSGDNAQSGIYVRSDGSYGTKMYLATTDAYASGAKTRMMIDYNGNVGIGTTNPAYKLHVAGIGSGNGVLIGNYNDQLGWNGSGGKPFYAIRFAGYRDVVSNFTGAMISAVRSNLCCSGLSQSMNLSFFVQPYTATVSGDGNLYEAARMDYAGIIATDYYYFSDKRLKSNVEPIQYGLSDLLKMNPVSYSMAHPRTFNVNDGLKDATTEKSFGFIAQDLNNVAPELVNKPQDPNSYWSVSYGKLTPILVKSIQEQQKMIEALQKQNEIFKQEIEELKKK
ncbi:MAG: tail fiber domain-containing protein [Chitinophagales bacterium]